MQILHRISMNFIRNNSIRNKSIRNNSILYTTTGEWVVTNSKDKTSFIGLTKDSIEQLSEIVYIDPIVNIGDKIKIDEELIALESVKATATINAVNNCEIIDINYDLFDNLDNINNEPENTEKSWIVKTTT